MLSLKLPVHLILKPISVGLDTGQGLSTQVRFLATTLGSTSLVRLLWIGFRAPSKSSHKTYYHFL